MSKTFWEQIDLINRLKTLLKLSYKTRKIIALNKAVLEHSKSNSFLKVKQC